MLEVHTYQYNLLLLLPAALVGGWEETAQVRKEKPVAGSRKDQLAVMSLSKPEELLALELSCPICFQLFADPVVLPCGHNYCRGCIEATANMACKVGARVNQCPECRQEFHNVETLQRNFKLCSIIEGFKVSRTQPCDDRTTEMPEDDDGVLCDHCIDEASPAAKACLKCEVSLCSRHFQKHQEKESFRAHSVVDVRPSEAPHSCDTHRRPLEYFCSTDVTLLCAGCFTDGRHQNHDVLTFGAAEEEMRRALEIRSKVRHVS